MANTVMNPGLPYVGPIPGGLRDGSMITVSGVPEHHHNGFAIYLQTGPQIDPRSEVALTFNPRFNENCVVRNSLQNGAWGSEERHGGFPFHRGQNIDVVILVKPHHYKVSVNGRHFCDYNHRIPKHRVTHLTVEQGLRCNMIRFDGQGGFPHGGGAGGFLPPGAAPYPAPGGNQPIYNPPVPFVQNISGGVYPGKMIFISGIPHPGASRFSVYIQHGQHHEPRDIAMVVDARFNYGADMNQVVRNHKQGNWGTEEKGVPYFPFAQNANFDMIIMVENNSFKVMMTCMRVQRSSKFDQIRPPTAELAALERLKTPQTYNGKNGVATFSQVAVNNQHLLEFYHRIQPIQRCDTLRIDGDVRLTQVRFQ